MVSPVGSPQAAEFDAFWIHFSAAIQPSLVDKLDATTVSSPTAK
jgi:hypothetical protein